MSKTSETIALFHEMKFADVARLFERRSLEFRSHRRMNHGIAIVYGFAKSFPELQNYRLTNRFSMASPTSLDFSG